MKRPLRLLLFFLILLGCALYMLKTFHLLPEKTYTAADFGIQVYTSTVDKDGDGIDDQTDILTNVRAYTATEPKYKSKYYAAGYPDDEYGVCTDVVAQGLLHAGYDLMELVDADIAARPEAYSTIEKADKSIDFRRVRNLNVYFKEHALSLTCDLSDIGAWQGGDIVVFNKHIGIVSDKRNKDGIPYLIHHANPYQLRYEENTLMDKQDTIIGHYRIS